MTIRPRHAPVLALLLAACLGPAVGTAAELGEQPTLSVATLDGGRFDLAEQRGQWVVVNFWATWCPPCVEELPLLDRFYQEQQARGWQVLGLAVDQAAPVVRFLERLPLSFPVVLAGFAGTDLSRTLGNPSGALPFSVVFGADGAVLHRKLGKVSADELAQWARLV